MRNLSSLEGDFVGEYGRRDRMAASERSEVEVGTREETLEVDDLDWVIGMGIMEEGLEGMV